jgi:hypothetical protein
MLVAGGGMRKLLSGAMTREYMTRVVTPLGVSPRKKRKKEHKNTTEAAQKIANREPPSKGFLFPDFIVSFSKKIKIQFLTTSR